MPQKGDLHITLFDSKTDTYSVRFTPYQRGGGAQAHRDIQGRDRLKEYLLRLNTREDMEKALQELQQKQSCDIPHVWSDC
jgi:hypothetical protein